MTMTWSAQHAQASRRVTRELIDLAEGGVIDWENLARDLLGWMSEEDVAEFSRRNDYITHDEDEK